MAAATVKEYFNTSPQTELVTLTCSDGETYQSRKFQNVFGAIASPNSNHDYDINCTISGDTITINMSGPQSDKLITLELFGKIWEDY